MNGHPPAADPAPESTKAPRAMTAEEIDKALSALAGASAVLLRECEAEQRRMEELNELNEADIEQRAEKQTARYDARSVLLSVRLRLAINNAKRHRDAAREFVCWWVDAAVLAWKSAVFGTPLLYARMGAAVPSTMMDDDDLWVLPKADDHVRRIVELGAFLGQPLPGSGGDYDGLVAGTADLAARSGLLIRRDEAGDVRVTDDDESEARRCRLWGDMWTEHRIPALPDPDELHRLLAHTPKEAAEPMRTAIRAVVQSASGRERMSELEGNEDPWTAAEITEYGQLSDRLDQLTELLAVSARAITSGLADVRTANGSRDDPSSER